MFRRILIANRGEVAARVTRTARRMGIEVVAVASEADRDLAWLSEVDEVVVIGPAKASGSYLDAGAILEAGIHTRCAAVHPGWGFLSENEAFATRCEAAGLTFVGPAPRHLREMGDKARARRVMSELGMPVIAGTKRPLESAEQAARVAEEVGYPVLLKAVAGGGGRGMRPVDEPGGLHAAWAEASAEALACFGDPTLYLEHRIVGGRHIEVQVVGDGRGGCVHLGERECSLQRRHQKVLEEAPAPGLDPRERERILPLVAEVIGRTGYRGAGTVEMLVDRNGSAWFMEMNTRLQVEHPVTEQITGIDLVEWQLRVAAGESIPRAQQDISMRGHAIECRINAEDPDRNFAPCPGRVTGLRWPEGEGIRVETHLRPGDRIAPHYDSMVAKLICTGPDRDTAIRRMGEALAASEVQGVTTNIGLHKKILAWPAFLEGRYDVGSLEREVA